MTQESTPKLEPIFCNKCGFSGLGDPNGVHNRPRDGKECHYSGTPTRTPAASQSDEAKAVAASLRGWAAGTTNSYEGEQLKERLLQAAALLERPPQSIPTASQSEALVEELARTIKQVVHNYPPHVKDPVSNCSAIVARAILPIIAARESAAIQADRRGRTFSPTELDRAREAGRREGIEEAAMVADGFVGKSAGGGEFMACRRWAGQYIADTIRALAEKQP